MTEPYDEVKSMISGPLVCLPVFFHVTRLSLLKESERGNLLKKHARIVMFRCKDSCRSLIKRVLCKYMKRLADFVSIKIVEVGCCSKCKSQFSRITPSTRTIRTVERSE